MLLEINDIQYQLIDQNNVDEVVHLVSDHFVKNEYLTRESGLNYSEFQKLVNAYCRVDLLEKLSVVAVEAVTQRIIGFAVSEDPKSQLAVTSNDFISLSKNFEPFFSVLEDLHHVSIDFEIKQKECFHLFLLGVLPEFQGRGIGKQLIKVSETLAKERGFNYVMVEATSPATKPLCDNIGYRTLGQLCYADYVFKNTKPYSHLTDYDGPYLLIKYI